MMTTSQRARSFGAAVIALAMPVAACRTVGQPGAQQQPLARESIGGGAQGSSRDNALEIDRDGGRSRAPVAAAAAATAFALPRWAKPSESTGELFGAVDGRCNHLGVSRLENETLVHYGRNVWDGAFRPTIARATDDAVVVDPAMNAGLEDTGDIHYMTGRWPDAAYLMTDNGARAGYAPLAFRFAGGKWKPAFALPENQGVNAVVPYGAGAIGLRQCVGGSEYEGSCVSGIFMGDNAKAPPITGDGFTPSSFRALPTGEIFAVGTVCKGNDSACAGQLRWWSPGSKVGYTPVAAKVSRDEGMILVKSKTEIYVAQGNYFGMFDGAKLTKLSAPNNAGRTLHDAKDGGIWLSGESKVWHRKVDATYEDVTPPQYAGGGLAGVSEGAPWAIVKGNQLFKRVSGAWQKVDVPRPPFSSTAAFLTLESVAVHAPDDVFVIASYAELQPGWNEVEKRLTLLRTKRPKETIRCEMSGHGFESWPPPAADGCTTPFVVLAPVSATSPKDFDYPKTRSTLRPKASLVVGGELAEIRENGKVWIGAVPTSVASGRTLAQLYSVTFPMTHSEVVCAEPTIARRIAIDPAAKK